MSWAIQGTVAASPAGGEGWCRVGGGTAGRRSDPRADGGVGLYWLTHVTLAVSPDWSKTTMGILLRGGHVILVSETGGF